MGFDKNFNGDLPLSNPVPPMGPHYAKKMGLVISDAVRRTIKAHRHDAKIPFKRTGMLSKAIGSEATGNEVSIFYDLGKAKYAGMFEHGGEIRAFRARKPHQRTMRMAFGKYVANPRLITVKVPRPMLFIPLNEKGRFRQGKLTFGVDYILKEKVTLPSHYMMRDTIREMIGPKKALMDKIIAGQLRLTEVFKKGQWLS